MDYNNDKLNLLEPFKTNRALIPHYKCQRIDLGTLKKELKIEIEHLKEKNTWFYIEGKLMFFKAREDYRLFTELFCSLYGQLLGYNTVDYSVAYVTDTSIDKEDRDKQQLGILSPNFQVRNKHYYLFSDLYNTEISNLRHYGEYCLTNLLAYFEHQCPSSYFKRIKQQLISLYIFDYFCDQVDRNPKNLSCEVQMRSAKEKHYDALHSKVVELILSKIYDNERSLGLCCKHGLTLLDNSTLWGDKFPYKPGMNKESDGIPNNLIEVCLDYPKEAFEAMDRLIREDEYKKILEQFIGMNKPIILKEDTVVKIENGFQERQKVLRKIKSILT